MSELVIYRERSYAVTDQELIDKYIEPNPDKPGIANARVVTHGISVWALIGYLEAYNGDIDETAAAFEIPREFVEAARAYYHRHREVIDDRRGANVA